MRSKSDHHPASKHLYPIQTLEPRQIISVDIVSKLRTSSDSRNYVCACVDSFSGYLVAYPIRRATTTAIILCLEQYFVHLGLPKIMLTDNSPCFLSRKFQAFHTRQTSEVGPHNTISPTGQFSEADTSRD